MSGSSLHRIASGGDVNIKAGSAHLDKTNTGYIQTNLNEKVGGSIALSAGDSYGKTKDDKGGDMSMTAGNAHGGDGGSILIKSGRSDRASGKCWFVVCDDCLHLCHEFYNMMFPLSISFKGGEIDIFSPDVSTGPSGGISISTGSVHDNSVNHAQGMVAALTRNDLFWYTTILKPSLFTSFASDSGTIEIATGDTPTGLSGGIKLLAGSSGLLKYRDGGNVLIAAGDVTSTGGSGGSLELYSGNSNKEKSGEVKLMSPSGVSGSTGDVTVSSGSTENPFFESGALILASGAGGRNKGVIIEGGESAKQMTQGGGVSISSGDGNSGGDISIIGGDSTGGNQRDDNGGNSESLIGFCLVESASFPTYVHRLISCMFLVTLFSPYHWR